MADTRLSSGACGSMQCAVTSQRRFVRHVLPYWNVHRHRAAPEAAKIITELIAAGTLRMVTASATSR
jgi:uncharacterized NAD(P)/FAD-binding protein YdhS